MFDTVLYLTHPLLWASKIGRDQLPYSVQVHMQPALKGKNQDDKKRVRQIYADAVGHCIISILQDKPESLKIWEDAVYGLIKEFEDKSITSDTISSISAKAKKSVSDGHVIDRVELVGQLKAEQLERALRSLFNVGKIPGLILSTDTNLE